MPSPKPCSIADVFEQMEEISLAASGNPRLLDAVIEESGIPNQQLCDAMVDQFTEALAELAAGGPQQLGPIMGRCFVAGAVWEQGRRG